MLHKKDYYKKLLLRLEKYSKIIFKERKLSRFMKQVDTYYDVGKITRDEHLDLYFTLSQKLYIMATKKNNRSY